MTAQSLAEVRAVLANAPSDHAVGVYGIDVLTVGVLNRGAVARSLQELGSLGARVTVGAVDRGFFGTTYYNIKIEAEAWLLVKFADWLADMETL